MKTDEARKLATQALEELALALDDGHSPTLTAYLKAMARFHRYSLHNQLLIASQRPEASRVAGFGAWRALGRQVRAGERGIAILAPITHRRTQRSTPPAGDPDNHKTTTESPADEPPASPIAFRTAYVFDISQTDGRPLPEFATVQGDPGPYLERLLDLVTHAGIRVEFADHLGGAEGVSRGGVIVLRRGRRPAETLSTLVHEYAHERLHQGGDPSSRRTRELEAEAVAYVVCQAVGLDSGTASSDYIQLYDGDRTALMASLERIRSTAATILRVLCSDAGADERPTTDPARSPRPTCPGRVPASAVPAA